MQDANLVRGHTVEEEVLNDLVEPGERVVDTSGRKTDGFDKCPRCGSTEIGYSLQHQALVCKYCRFEWNEAVADTEFGFDSPIDQLRGIVRGSGTDDITVDESVVTLKCPGCGAEVVMKTEASLQASCHWCRQVLSLSQKLPNGAVPDAVLPFTLKQEQGAAAVAEFTKSRRFFATRDFRRHFKQENVRGVFLPYMLVDGNLRARVEGYGEILTGQYRRKVGDDQYITVYSADEYLVGRRFDLTVDDLITESNSARANIDLKTNTNNILNAVLPFDTKNAVAYNSNYLTGFTSEKRDLDILQMQQTVEDNFLSIARAEAGKMIGAYDRGVRWEQEGLEVKGSRWVAVYLPVWLYSFRDSADGMIHYIAVNGRTGKTMGSVPIARTKLFLTAALAGIVTTAMTLPIALFGG